MRMKTSSLKYDKLNVGSGTDIRKGYVNLDKFKFDGTDIIWDIDKIPFPFKDSSFSEILIKHVIEHVNDVVAFMSEIYRISKPGAKIFIEAPYFSGVDAVGDPTHKHFFAAKTFDFFEKGKLGNENYFEQSQKIDFKVKKVKIVFSNNKFLKIFNGLVNISHKVYERFFAHILPSQVILAELIVKK